MIAALTLLFIYVAVLAWQSYQPLYRVVQSRDGYWAQWRQFTWFGLSDWLAIGFAETEAEAKALIDGHWTKNPTEVVHAQD